MPENLVKAVKKLRSNFLPELRRPEFLLCIPIYDSTTETAAVFSSAARHSSFDCQFCQFLSPTLKVSFRIRGHFHDCARQERHRACRFKGRPCSFRKRQPALGSLEIPVPL